jgi:ATP-dependent Clp protease, protease subunit
MKRLTAIDAKPRFRAALDDDGGLELTIYGDIVDAASLSMLDSWGVDTATFTSALTVKQALDEAGEYSKIRVRINSPGGDVFEGLAIHSLLIGQSKPVECYIDGIAASSASLIAMAGSKRVMGVGSMLMVHRAWASCTGNSADMVKMSFTLDKVDGSIAAVYQQATGMKLADIQNLMNDETWLSPDDCVKAGFATEIAETPQTPAAMAQARRFAALGRLKHVPKALKASSAPACPCDCENCVAGDCDACAYPDCNSEACEDCPMQAAGTSNLSLYQIRARQCNAPAPEESNLSLFEARAAMVGRAQV